MSRSQLSRIPQNFPRMKWRARGRIYWIRRGGGALGASNPGADK
jgi:hypothetical protein